MDEESLNLLRKIVSLKSVSIYDLAESYARQKRTQIQKVFDDVVKVVYLLASKALVELIAVEGLDGLETQVKPTSAGETYVKSPLPEMEK